MLNHMKTFGRAALNSTKSGLQSAMRFTSRNAKAILPALVVVCMLALPQIASAQTLAEPLGEGITLSDYITMAIAKISGVVITALGGWFAFKIIRKGLGWVGRALG